jgi:hypothetical protein
MAEHEAALAALQMGIQTEIDGYDFYVKFGAPAQCQGRARGKRSVGGA